MFNLNIQCIGLGKFQPSNVSCCHNLQDDIGQESETQIHRGEGKQTDGDVFGEAKVVKWVILYVFVKNELS
jgi:hypothetical protein